FYVPHVAALFTLSLHDALPILAELSDGRIYYNSRSHTATDAMRRIAFSEDGGVTWLNSRRSDTLPDGMRGTPYGCMAGLVRLPGDRKSTRLNSSHVKISYAVFC